MLAGDMRGRIGLALDNLEAMLSATGFTFADIVMMIEIEATAVA